MADISNITVSAEGVDTVCKIKDKVARNDIAINRTTLGVQCKNLLKNTAVTTTKSGITFTVNDDKSITVSGTATSRIIFFVGTAYISQTGNYTYTGTPSGGASSTYSMNYRNSNNVYKTAETGNGITAQFEGGKTYEAVIDIRSGVTISNLTFYPMLRDADITDSTYEPYKENVDERLIKNKSDIAVNKSTLGYQRKNILDETGYLSSITSVTRGKKSISGNQITLTATAADCYTKPSADSDGGFRISVEPNTDYILSWNSDNSNSGNVYIFMNGTTDGRKSANNNGSKTLKFTTNSDTTFITIRLGVSNSGNSITYSNIMLRYADILDDTYEPYQPSVQEQINNFGTQQQLLCDYSSSATSSVTIQITGLFSNYSAVICIVKYYLGTTSITLPLKYIKSIGKSKEYSPVLDLGFRYVDDNNLLIGGADAAISSVKIISLY